MRPILQMLIGVFLLSTIHTNALASEFFHLITIEHNEGGRIIWGDSTLLPKSFRDSVPEGSEIILHAIPDEGYFIAETTINGDTIRPEGLIQISASKDQNVQVVFAKENETPVMPEQNYTLWVAYDKSMGTIRINDTIPSSMAGSVSADKTVKVSVYPNEGYDIKELWCNEEIVSQEKDTVYYLNLTKSSLIQVLFENPERPTAECTTLSIRGIGGTIEQQVAIGTTPSFRIIPDEGKVLHNLLFNDIDMTALVDSGNTFTTPIITDSSSLSIVFEEVSALQERGINSLKVYGYDNKIIIENLPENENVSIYNELGILVKSLNGKEYSDTRIEIALPTSRNYIVKALSTSFKIVL